MNNFITYPLPKYCGVDKHTVKGAWRPIKPENRQMTIDKWTDILIEMLDEVDVGLGYKRTYWRVSTCGHCEEFYSGLTLCGGCGLGVKHGSLTYCLHGEAGLKLADTGNWEHAIEHCLMLLDGVEL